MSRQVHFAHSFFIAPFLTTAFLTTFTGAAMSNLSAIQQTAQPHPVRAPRGTAITCKNWLIEAAYRMIQNNLDPEVAENPDALVVYGGIGKAARNWDCYEAILKALEKLNED